MLMELVEKLQFLNECGELETIKTGDRAEAFGKQWGKSRGQGGSRKKLCHHLSFFRGFWC